MHLRKSAAIFSAALAFTFLAAGAQTAPAAPPSRPMPMGPSLEISHDELFARKAVTGDRAEIESAKLALQKSSNDGVKKFAQKMVDDHTLMMRTMLVTMRELRFPLPSSGNKVEKSKIDRLTALSGDAFDSAYVDAMVKDHKANVPAFQYEVKNGSIPQVRSAAYKALPIIELHLKMAEDLQKQISAAGSAAK